MNHFRFVPRIPSSLSFKSILGCSPYVLYIVAHVFKYLASNFISGKTSMMPLLRILGTANLDSVYTRPDPFGTGTKLVPISLVFTRGLMNSVRIGSAIWYQMGPLMKEIPKWNRTVPVSNRSRVNRIDPCHSGSDPKWI